MPMATRRDLIDPTDPAHLHPEHRKREVASILAAGVVRMRVRRCAASAARPRSASMSRISPESGEIHLELSRRSSPDGQCG
jgi:hypothetical protein